MHIIKQVIGHQFDYDKSHKILKISADLTEIGVPPPCPGGVGAATESDASEGGAVAAGGVSPPPCAPLHAVVALPRPSASFLVLSLGCAEIFRLGSEKRGRLGGRILARSSRFLRVLNLILLGLLFQMITLVSLRQRSSSRLDMTESLLSFFSDKSGRRVSSS
jgi:hypothetical protein